MALSFTSANPFPSHLNATYAKHGMVATSQPQAAQVGRDILAMGGNAVDAAIATAAALTVVEPTGCGVGGDAFALVWIATDNNGSGKLHGLNASGPAPMELSRQAVSEAGHTTMPLYGWVPVTVPGTPAAWAELSQRFGKLDFATLLAPAIRLAREGFPVSPTIAMLWARAHKMYSQCAGEEVFTHWFDTFAPTGRAPKAGELHRCEALATTLEALAETRCESFYRGDLAREIDRFSATTGGFLRKEDLETYKPEWVDPISVHYRGVDVWEIPPNGQGLVALMALKMLEGWDVSSRDNPTSLHRQLECMKLAYTDGKQYITQPEHMIHSVSSLLDEEYLQTRRELVQDDASDPFPGTPAGGGTVYLATADSEGNMVSFIQSNYHGFGSGVVVPGTGISLQNRGHDFSLDPQHNNILEPGKKTFHTIIPGFLTQDGKPMGPFGVMGGFMQPQGHFQVVMNMIDYGLNPQAALDAPRWQWVGGKSIAVEAHYPVHLVRDMAERGHEVYIDHDSSSFGRGQVIIRDNETGMLCGGAEARTDSSIAVL